MNLPRIVPIRQKFPPRPLPDPLPPLIREIEKLIDHKPIPAGSRIAITAGSRNISNFPAILKTVAGELKKRGFRPFLLAAMGSHGGGTSEGKLKILAGHGVTEESIQAPITSTAKVTRVGDAADGTPILVDEEAARADRILVLNRVHPHPTFDGPIQSGLMKMLCVGLGNLTGAQLIHRHAIQEGLFSTILNRSRRILELLPIMGGIGIIENETGETAGIECFPSEDLERGEEALLWKSRKMRPWIPFSRFHLLIIDRIGKDISGTGMDPKIIGRLAPAGKTAAGPRIDRIYARGLTPASGGNAHGVGLADFVSKNLADSVDWEITRMNSLAAASPQRSRLPLVMKTDREAIDAAFLCCGPIGIGGARVVRIRDTRNLQELWVSEALLEEAGPRAGWSVTGNPSPLRFDPQGNLA